MSNSWNDACLHSVFVPEQRAAWLHEFYLIPLTETGKHIFNFGWWGPTSNVQTQSSMNQHLVENSNFQAATFCLMPWPRIGAKFHTIRAAALWVERDNSLKTQRYWSYALLTHFPLVPWQPNIKRDQKSRFWGPAESGGHGWKFQDKTMLNVYIIDVVSGLSSNYVHDCRGITSCKFKNWRDPEWTVPV